MVERVGGGPEEEQGDRASEGGKNVVEESALLGLFEPLCCNPVVCDSTAADPPSPFCVQIHSHSHTSREEDPGLILDPSPNSNRL